MARLTSSPQRIALVALLSYDGKAVLLNRPDGAAIWWPVSLVVPGGENIACAVRRWIRRAPVGDVRWGSVTGHLGVSCGSTGRLEGEVVVLKAAGPVDAERVDASARWWPVAGLSEAGVALFPSELGLLIEGYVDGWIPDGVVTLDV